LRVSGEEEFIAEAQSLRNAESFLITKSYLRGLLGAALAVRASQKVSPTVAGIQRLGHQLQVAKTRITRESPLAGKTLAEAALGQHAGFTVIGQPLSSLILGQ
jgi:hypothetical protein